MSVNAQVQFPKNENNLKGDKSTKPLFPKPADCSYVSCYCEENVWKLCQDVSIRIPGELDRCFVVFISNPCRTVPLWKQRAGREEDRLVIWDYHVIFLYALDSKSCLVYDLDSELPFPTFFHKYVTETFRTDQVLKSDFHRFFRVVSAKQFLQHFASDRRHMKRPDGTWIKPPPAYPAICTSTSTHNLDEYINMDTGTGPGQVFNLTDFVQRFYKIEK
ncbi:protein N-terminal glutamine amidohydrolase [Aricia agestis]|uniref:protein N-terminal glutamine amidohydrolase n=1 Tax=Aricia agestis TaxID=91739 RepID=UPI001C207A37|nr:protein N-terminal glutamine amidohydrolase [Aricia agestis]